MVLKGLGTFCLTLLLFVGLAEAQMESANFRLANGSYTGGGGQSSGQGLEVTGTIPISGSRMNFADNWAVYTGLVGIGLGQGGEFLAFYSNHTLDTVELVAHELRVSYGGGAGSLSGKLFFRPGGARGYNVASLIKSVGDTLEALLPADSIGLRGLEYYFELFRGNDTIELAAADSPYVWITHFTNAQGRMPDLTRAGSYRMVSLPIEIEGSRLVRDVFEDDLGSYDPTRWRLGGYDARQDSVFEYTLAAPAYPGRSYWLITKDRESFGAAGYSVRPELIHNGVPYYAVPCERGWNQIAVPYGFSVNFQDVIYERNGVIGIHDSTASVYWFAGAGYSSPSVMNPWSGYFFFTWETDLRLLFPYQEYGIPTGAKPAVLTLSENQFDWSIGISLRIGSSRSEPCYAVVNSSGTENLDRFDQPMPPAAPGLPVCGFSMARSNRYLWRIDARAPVEDQREWTLALGPGKARRLDIEGIATLPQGYTALLVLNTGAQRVLTTDTQIPIADDVRSARLIVGTDKTIKQEVAEALPETYSLDQNFPNPFNPSTTIRFSLPEPGDVRLDIYNLLGQQVVQLIDRPMEAGVHDLVWDGKDSGGRNVASGVYFYRLQSKSFQATKKMLLIK